MADTRVSDLTEVVTLADADLLYVIDASVTSESAAGSSRKAQASSVRTYVLSAIDTLAELNTLVTDATLDDSSSARTPTAHATTHQHGGADEVATATPAANAIPKAGAGNTLADGWIAATNVTQHEAALTILTSQLSGTITTAQIGDDQVTYAKLQNVSQTNVFLGRDTAGAGIVEEISASAARTILNVADGANNYVHPNHTGDVTSLADGATTIALGAVTYAKMQDISAASLLLGRGSAAADGPVQEITLGTNLSMSGTTLNATGGGGGAPTDAQYWVSAANGTLSDEVVVNDKASLEAAVGSIDFALASGDIYSGVHNFSNATALQIPLSAVPTVDQTGEVAIDSAITGHDGLIKFFDGANLLLIPAIRASEVTTTDGHGIFYDSALEKFVMEAPPGAGGGGGDALTSNPLSQFAATSSAQLAGVMSDETGTGLLVFGTSPVLTTPQINDTTGDHQYIVAVSELTLDRTVTLPLLTANDIFVFNDHAATLTTKTIALGSNVVSGTQAQFNTACTDGDFSFTGHAHAASDITSGTLVHERGGLEADVSAFDGILAVTAGGTVSVDTKAELEARIGSVDLALASGDTYSGTHNFSGAVLVVPTSATPTVDAAGEIALDTTITDFSTGLLKYFSAEEMAVIAVPIAELTTPTDGDFVAYNATNDEFELRAVSVPGGNGLDDLTDVTITTAARGDIFYRNATEWVNLPAGTSGHFLKTQGAAADPIWAAVPGGGDALTSNPLSQFAATTSSQLAGVISDETGSGLLVFATSPTLVTPALGTPSSGTLTNCTGLPLSGTTGTLTHEQGGLEANVSAFDGILAVTAGATVSVDTKAELEARIGSVDLALATGDTYTGTHNFSGATLSGMVVTAFQIHDVSQNHQYQFVPSELTADRNVTLPLLTGDDIFTFNDFEATLTTKTIALGSNTVSGTMAQFNTAVTDGDFLFTADLPTLSRSITVESPTASEDISVFFTPVAITVTEMRAVLVGSASPSVTWTIRHSTDRSAAGNEVVTSGTTTTSVTTGSDVTSFNDATIPADSFIWLETTAMSGTVGQITITIVYTED